MSADPGRPVRSKAERDRMVEKFLPLVRYVAARLPVTIPSSLDRDDFYSVGVMGLMHAASTYDPRRGASFKTFAYTAIRGAILDEIRRHDPVPRNRRERLRRMARAVAQLEAELRRPPSMDEIATSLGVTPAELDDDLLALHTCRTLSLDEASADAEGRSALGSWTIPGDNPDPGDDAAHREQVSRLSQAIAELPETDRHVVVLYHFENLFLKEIGEILGVSESRVCQVLARATARLRLKLRETAESKETA
jgi:RNA polymerase sigma factor for flagellar operon FliA